MATAESNYDELPQQYQSLRNVLIQQMESIKHNLLVFGYLRTQIENTYNCCIPNEIKNLCSQFASKYLIKLNGSAKNKIQQALMTTYNQKVADCASLYFEDEGFDEETIIDDITDIETDDLDNCSIIGHLADNYPKQFAEGKKQEQLLIVLQNALKGECSAFFEIKNKIDPQLVQWKISRAEAKNANDFVTKHCPPLSSVEKRDNALIDVIAIGIKNDFPLLNWLTDTYTRFRINNYYLNKRDFSTCDWKKKYKFFHSLQKTQKRTTDKLDVSIKSFFRKMFNTIRLQQSISVVDDNINEYIEYFIAMNEAIEILATKYIVPFQVDMWIIPKNVESAIRRVEDIKDDESEESDCEEFEEIGADIIGNLEYRLKANEFRYTLIKNEMRENINYIRGKFVQQLVSFIKGRSQRVIVYIDRRNPQYVITENKCADYVKNNYGLIPDDNGNLLQRQWRYGRRSDKRKTWNDTIYFVQTSKKRYDEIHYDHTPETSFWASRECMLPAVKHENIGRNKGFGCMHDFNGYQFMLSWHVDSIDLIRCYWFSNCWATRFFPLDCVMLWPKYFKNVKYKEQIVKDDYHKRLKVMKQCVDDGFKHWFETTTGTKLSLFS